MVDNSRRHHRPPARRGQDRAHGAARPAHRLANRTLLLREMQRRLEGPEAGGEDRHTARRSRRIQSRQRHARPSFRRRLAEGRRRSPAGDGRRVRAGRAHRRRRIRRAARATTTTEACSRLAEELLEAIRRPFEIDGYLLSIRPSVGVARAPRDGSDVETLLKNADLALYAAKSEGRDRIGYFEPSLERDIREAAGVEGRDHRGDRARASSNCITSRSSTRAGGGSWKSRRWCAGAIPTRGMIRPDHFIPLAEQSGLIHEIGEFVLRAACRAAARWPADDRRRGQSLAGAIRAAATSSRWSSARSPDPGSRPAG